MSFTFESFFESWLISEVGHNGERSCCAFGEVLEQRGIENRKNSPEGSEDFLALSSPLVACLELDGSLAHKQGVSVCV